MRFQKFQVEDSFPTPHDFFLKWWGRRSIFPTYFDSRSFAAFVPIITFPFWQRQIPAIKNCMPCFKIGQ